MGIERTLGIRLDLIVESAAAAAQMRSSLQGIVQDLREVQETSTNLKASGFDNLVGKMVRAQRASVDLASEMKSKQKVAEDTAGAMQGVANALDHVAASSGAASKIDKTFEGLERSANAALAKLRELEVANPIVKVNGSSTAFDSLIAGADRAMQKLRDLENEMRNVGRTAALTLSSPVSSSGAEAMYANAQRALERHEALMQSQRQYKNGIGPIDASFRDDTNPAALGNSRRGQFALPPGQPSTQAVAQGMPGESGWQEYSRRIADYNAMQAAYRGGSGRSEMLGGQDMGGGAVAHGQHVGEAMGGSALAVAASSGMVRQRGAFDGRGTFDESINDAQFRNVGPQRKSKSATGFYDEEGNWNSDFSAREFGGGSGGNGGGRGPGGGGGSGDHEFNHARSMRRWGQETSSAGLALGMNGAMLMAPMIGAIKSATDLDDLLKRNRESFLQSGGTEKGAAIFNESVLALAGRVGGNQRSQVSGAYNMISSMPDGFDLKANGAAQALAFGSERIAKLAIAGGSSTHPISNEEAALDTHAMITNLGVDATTPAKYKKAISEMTNILINLKNTTATEVDLASSSFRAMGPMFKQLGFNRDEAIGMIDLFAHAKIRGSQAGNFIKRIASRDVLPPEKLDKVEQVVKKTTGVDIGLYGKDGQPKMFGEQIMSILKAEKHMTPEKAAGVNQMISGLYAMPGLFALLEQGRKAFGNTNFLADRGKKDRLSSPTPGKDATEAAYASRSEGNVKVAAQQTQGDLGKAWQHTFSEIAPDLIKLLQIIDRAVNAFDRLPGPVKRFGVEAAGAFAIAMVGIGGFGLFIGNLTTGLGALLGFAGSIGTSIGGLGTAFTGLVAGGARIVPLLAGIAAEAGPVEAGVAGVGVVVGGMGAAFAAIPAVLAAVTLGLVAFSVAWVNDWGNIREKTGAIIGSLTHLFSGIVAKVAPELEKITEMAKHVLLDEVPSVIGAGAVKIGDAMHNAGVAAYNGFLNGLAGLGNAVANVFNGLIPLALHAGSAAGAAYKSALAAAKGVAADPIGAAKSGAASFLTAHVGNDIMGRPNPSIHQALGMFDFGKINSWLDQHGPQAMNHNLSYAVGNNRFATSMRQGAENQQRINGRSESDIAEDAAHGSAVAGSHAMQDRQHREAYRQHIARQRQNEEASKQAKLDQAAADAAKAAIVSGAGGGNGPLKTAPQTAQDRALNQGLDEVMHPNRHRKAKAKKKGHGHAQYDTEMTLKPGESLAAVNQLANSIMASMEAHGAKLHKKWIDILSPDGNTLERVMAAASAYKLAIEKLTPANVNKSTLTNAKASFTEFKAGGQLSVGDSMDENGRATSAFDEEMNLLNAAKMTKGLTDSSRAAIDGYVGQVQAMAEHRQHDIDSALQKLLAPFYGAGIEIKNGAVVAQGRGGTNQAYDETARTEERRMSSFGDTQSRYEERLGQRVNMRKDKEAPTKANLNAELTDEINERTALKRILQDESDTRDHLVDRLRVMQTEYDNLRNSASGGTEAGQAALGEMKDKIDVASTSIESMSQTFVNQSLAVEQLNTRIAETKTAIDAASGSGMNFGAIMSKALGVGLQDASKTFDSGITKNVDMMIERALGNLGPNGKAKKNGQSNIFDDTATSLIGGTLKSTLTSLTSGIIGPMQKNFQAGLQGALTKGDFSGLLGMFGGKHKGTDAAAITDPATAAITAGKSTDQHIDTGTQKTSTDLRAATTAIDSSGSKIVEAINALPPAIAAASGGEKTAKALDGITTSFGTGTSIDGLNNSGLSLNQDPNGSLSNASGDPSINSGIGDTGDAAGPGANGPNIGVPGGSGNVGGLASALSGALSGGIAASISSALGIGAQGGGFGAIGGALGGVAGELTGIPGLGVIGGLIGSLFGSHAKPATSPDIFDTQNFGQIIANLQGSAGASGHSFTEDSATKSSLGGATELGFIQRWVQANVGSSNTNTANIANDLLSQFGDANTGANGMMTADPHNIGHQSVTGGNLSGEYTDLDKAAKDAIASIQGLGNAALAAADSAARLSASFVTQLLGGPSGFNMPDFIGADGQAIATDGAPSVAAQNSKLTFGNSLVGNRFQPNQSGSANVGGGITVNVNVNQQNTGSAGGSSLTTDQITAAVASAAGDVAAIVNKANYDSLRYQSGHISQISSG